MPSARLLLAALIAALAMALGGFFYGRHVEALSWQAATAALKVQAADTLRQADARAAAADQRAAALATQLEESHAQRVQIEAAAQGRMDDLARRLDRLRRQPRRGPGCAGALSGAPVAAAGGGGPASGHPPGAAGSFQQLAQIAGLAVRLAEAAQTCHDWAAGIARAPVN